MSQLLEVDCFIKRAYPPNRFFSSAFFYSSLSNSFMNLFREKNVRMLPAGGGWGGG